MKNLTKSYIFECASNFSEAVNSSLSETQTTIKNIVFYQVGKDHINKIYLGFKNDKFYYGKLNLEDEVFSFNKIKEKPYYLGNYK